MPNRSMNSQIVPDKKMCLACSKPLRGRADKKFCDDFCRNSYNNQLKAQTNNYVRNIGNILRKNRRVLKDLLPDSETMVKTNKENLIRMGFHFKYSTHSYTNKKGNTYLFCFEYGYLNLDNDWFLIVRRKEPGM